MSVPVTYVKKATNLQYLCTNIFLKNFVNINVPSFAHLKVDEYKNNTQGKVNTYKKSCFGGLNN